jgi:hypothetical protein
LLVVLTNGYMRHEESLQGSGEPFQALRLRHQVIFQALGAQPLAFLKDDGSNRVLPWYPRSTRHAADGITTHWR